MPLPQDINEREFDKFELTSAGAAVRTTLLGTTEGGSTKYHLCEVIEDGGNTYLGKQDTNANWLFVKITTTPDLSYASKRNNPTVTSYNDL